MCQKALNNKRLNLLQATEGILSLELEAELLSLESNEAGNKYKVEMLLFIRAGLISLLNRRVNVTTAIGALAYLTDQFIQAGERNKAWRILSEAAGEWMSEEEINKLPEYTDLVAIFRYELATRPDLVAKMLEQ